MQIVNYNPFNGSSIFILSSFIYTSIQIISLPPLYLSLLRVKDATFSFSFSNFKPIFWFAARSNVPKFGNWENEDSVPYTVYFDKARKKKTGEPMINPNDPQQNPDVFPKPKTRPEEPIGKIGPVRPTTPEHREGDFRQFSNSSGRSNNESGSGGRGQRPARVARPSDQGFDRSPLHPHFQAKVVGRAGGSPAWEGRNYDNSHGTPVRSRIRPAQGDESPEKGTTVPKFGAWDENDPQAAENFTHIFKRVQDEKNTGTGNPMATPKHNSYSTHSQPSDEPKRCCFPWW